MSDLRRLIARMDQLNEAGPVMTPQSQADIRSQADYGGEDDDARDQYGNLKRSTSPGLGGTIDIGGVDIPSDAIASGLGSAAAMGGLKNVGGSKFNKPTAKPAATTTTQTTPATVNLGSKSNDSKDKRWAYQSNEPGTMQVTPSDKPVTPTVEKPAVFRKRGDPNFDPTLSKTEVGKTDAERRQAVADINAKLDTLPKPKINAKDYEAHLAKLRKLQKQISGDPRPAVWKDPRNPSAPASKSPPAANVEPPAPLKTPSKTTSSKPVDANVDAGEVIPSSLGSLGQEPVTAPTSSGASVYGPGGIKNFRRDAPLNPDSIEYPVGKNAAETQAINLQKAADQAAYDKSLETPYFNPGLKTLAATTAAAALGPYNKPDPNNPSPLDRYKGPGGNAQMAWDAYRAKQYDDAQKQKQQQQPASDKNSATDTEQTKESLHDKLFKEFKTFVEKR